MLTTLDIHEQQAIITLNRPEKRNALSSELVSELMNRLDEIERHSTVKVVILQGAGKAFCAGADLAYLKEISQFSIMENYADSHSLKKLFYRIYTFPLPVIAKVHGPAIAGGCGLATLCDFVVASKEKAIFGYSEVKIGFIPALVSVYLVRKIGETAARRLLLSAENINAEEALRLGLITHAVDENSLDNEVQRIADMLIKNSSSAMKLTKDMLASVQGMSLQAGLEYASGMNALARMTDDCQQGLAAFVQQ